MVHNPFTLGLCTVDQGVHQYFGLSILGNIDVIATTRLFHPEQCCCHRYSLLRKQTALFARKCSQGSYTWFSDVVHCVCMTCTVSLYCYQLIRCSERASNCDSKAFLHAFSSRHSIPQFTQDQGISIMAIFVISMQCCDELWVWVQWRALPLRNTNTLGRGVCDRWGGGSWHGGQ